MLVINKITDNHYSVHRANEYAVYLGYVEWDTFTEGWEFVAPDLLINTKDLLELASFMDDLCDIIDESDSTD